MSGNEDKELTEHEKRMIEQFRMVLLRNNPTLAKDLARYARMRLILWGLTIVLIVLTILSAMGVLYPWYRWFNQ